MTTACILFSTLPEAHFVVGFVVNSYFEGSVLEVARLYLQIFACFRPNCFYRNNSSPPWCVWKWGGWGVCWLAGLVGWLGWLVGGWAGGLVAGVLVWHVACGLVAWWHVGWCAGGMWAGGMWHVAWSRGVGFDSTG